MDGAIGICDCTRWAKVSLKMQFGTYKVLLPCVLCLIAIRVALHLDWIQLPFKLIDQNNELFTRLVKLAAFLTACFFLWKRYKYCQRFNMLPGLKTNFGILGSYNIVYSNLKRIRGHLAMTEVLEGFHLVSSEKGADGFFTFWLGPIPFVQLSSPELVGEFITNYGDLPKSFFYDTLRIGLGDGLLTSGGKKWRYHRKLLTPTFHFKILESFMPTVRQNLNILTNRLAEDAQKNDGVIEDISKYIFPCTLDVLCESSMGININAQEHPESEFNKFFHTLLKITCKMTFEPLLWVNSISSLHPFTSFGRKLKFLVANFRAKCKQVTSEQYKSFKNNSASPSDPNKRKREPFINTLFREHLRRPKEFPMDCVQDEVNTFLAAGHDTIGWTLTYVLFMLGHHPEVQAKVHEEVDNFFSSFENEDDIIVDSLKELRYTDAVIKETLRLYPVAGSVARHADRDLQLGKFTIPRRTQVMISIRSLHRNPEYWAEPARFQPERFLDSKMSHPYAFLPFSAGPRNCIGQRYAMVLAKSAMAYIMRQFTVQSLTSIDSVLTIALPISVASCPIRLKLVNREK